MMGQLNIFEHDHNTFSMDGTQVGIFQEASQVLPCCFLQCHDHMHLEAQVIPPTFFGYFAGEMQEWAFADEELSILLILTDLAESHCPQLVPPGPLHLALLQ